ncbi:tetratricopeptide repeat protein [Ferruginibacter yonginensis]|uniref:histidine kinase n=1 Tax=Ferruginibacter yonginensis TaxID=1310416 RepID=A0ABV8QUD8_9BACT
MIKLVVSIALLMLQLMATAQNKEIDSLLKVLSKETVDSNLLKLNFTIGGLYMFDNSKKAITYFENTIPLAEKLNRPIDKANSYLRIGYCYRTQANFEKSLDNYLKAATIYETEKNAPKLGEIFISIGDVYCDNKNLKKSSLYLDKAEAIILQLKDSFQLSHLYYSKGILYDLKNNLDSSTIFFKNAYDIGVGLKSNMVIINSLSSIAINYKKQGKLKESLATLDSVLNIYNRIGATPDFLASLYNTYGGTYAAAKDYTKAKIAFEKSLSYSKIANTPDIEMTNYENMAELFAAMNDYKQQAIYLKKYYSLKDSIYSTDSKNKLVELEADYQIEKKNIELIKKEGDITKQKNQRNIFIIIALSAVLFLGGLSIFYGRIKKKNKTLHESNIIINQQKEELTTLNNVKDRLFSIISHDLRNPLITLRSYLMLADNNQITADQKQQFKKQTMQAVVQTSDMLDNLLAWANMQIKNTQVNVVPIHLKNCIDDVTSLVQAQAMQKNITIQQNLQVNTALGDENIINIAFRNLLTNAIKYSHNNGIIIINAQQHHNKIWLQIIDEGIGMTAQQIADFNNHQIDTTKGTSGEKGTGLGLFLTKELLAKIDAQLLIESNTQKGSTFTIQLNTV